MKPSFVIIHEENGFVVRHDYPPTKAIPDPMPVWVFYTINEVADFLSQQFILAKDERPQPKL